MSWNILCEKTTKDFNFEFYNSIKDIDEKDWENVLESKNLYLTRSYLSSLENSMKEVEFRYITFQNQKKKTVGIAALQILNFEDTGSKYNEFCVVKTSIKNKILNKLNLKVLVCGNAFVCGENGFLFSDEITDKAIFNNLSSAIFELKNREKEVSIILMKEFWPESFTKTENLKEYKFRDFEIDVNMILPIHTTWKSMDDYLQSMVTKFRTKAKSVFKKSSKIEAYSLSEEEITLYKNDIQELYYNVVQKSDFKFGKLNGESFLNFKRNLKDNFEIKGYFLDNKLIGFSTAFISEHFIDAGYIGLNYEYNFKYSLYQKMLYDLVEVAINKKVNELRLGRTAEEIKSGLGAKPVNMKLYLRHSKSLQNKLIKPIVQSITPSEFEIRDPFKAAFSI